MVLLFLGVCPHRPIDLAQRKTKVTCEHMTLLEPKRDQAGASPATAAARDQLPPGRRMPPGMPAAPARTPDNGDDDDIPF